ncbi:MAG: bifunctional diaminohydroxyphosphoribosylaminopyrimidine deaminase/5-amino-6-(5-phosphoribosylamino)uracil reductase RibD [Actinomycetaceae bacterium]|nr:bifunctional diaminohydroxyphosphoribosylaminopyrimidine deaminase/5-amino-6-(5-phosphoribosylamino)uracil reductase RibD [Actinomycetaceae bacterium]
MSGENPDYSAILSTAVTYASKACVHNGNPRVGCAIVVPGSSYIFYGRHEGEGTPHGEVAALCAARTAMGEAEFSRRAHVAQAIVTLEPCSHWGKTPPCTSALIQAGIGKVIYAVADPHPVACGGAEILREAGVNVVNAQEICDEHSVQAAYHLTYEWRVAVTRKRPWCIAKIAQTLDGYVAAQDGTSQWITGKAARDEGHSVRADVDAIIVGTGTVLADNPHLSARPSGIDNPHQPLKVIVGHRPIPRDFHIFDTYATRACHKRDDGEYPDQALSDTLSTADMPEPALRCERVGNVCIYNTHDLRAVLDDLWNRGIRTVLIEGGPTLVSAAMREGLVDRLDAYISPKVFGGGKKSLYNIGVHTLKDAPMPLRVQTQQLGEEDAYDVVMQMTYTKDPHTPTCTQDIHTRTCCSSKEQNTWYGSGEESKKGESFGASDSLPHEVDDTRVFTQQKKKDN